MTNMKKNIILTALFGLSLLMSCQKTAKPDYPDPEDISGMDLVRGYVDMGLSVKWASANFGAAEAWQVGEYYTWGDVVEITGPVTELDYRYVNLGDGKYTDYPTGSTLKPEDDIIAISTSGEGRIPTVAEAGELVDGTKCKWTYASYRSVKGYLVTSLINGASIFLPAAGYYAEEGLINDGFSAHIWTSAVSSDFNNFAYCLTASPIVNPGAGQMHRYIGTTLRAVKP